MADAMQGVMSLPTEAGAAGGNQDLLTPENAAVFEQLRQNFTPEQLNQELLTAGEEMDPQAVMQFKSMLKSMQLPVEVIDALGKIVDLALQNPDRYPELRADLIKEGVPEDILPPEFDAAYFGAMNMALDEMSAGSGTAPQGFAMGGPVSVMNPIAAGIASLGRNGDTMLAHITPSEARMLRRNGGSGTINPKTGLREFGFFSGIAKAVGGVFKGAAKAVSGAVKGVVGAVKSFAKSTVGKMVTAVALGFVLGPAAATYLGVSSAAGVAAISGFVGGAGSTLLAGGNLKDALRSGAMSALTAGAVSGVTQGFSTPYAGPTTVSGQLESVGKMFGKAPAAAGAADDAAVAAAGTADDVAPLSTDQVAPMNQMELRSAIDKAGGGTDVMPSAIPQPTATTTNLNPTIDTRFPAAGTPPSAPAQSAMYTEPSTPYGLTGETLQKKIGNLPTAYETPDITRAITDYQMPPSQGIGDLIGQGKYGEAASSMYKGASDLAKSGWDTAKGVYTDYISPSAIQQRGAEAAQTAGMEAYNKAISQGASKELALQMGNKAYEAAMPGMISTYGPAALATTAGIAALGGFKSQPAEKPETPELGSDLFARSPYQFMVPPGGVSTQYYGGVQGAQYGVPQMATGGIADLPSKFPRKTGPINGPGTATSDSIPAMLSDGEFVFTAKAVRSLGNGSRRLGAKRMYAMMKALEGKAA